MKYGKYFRAFIPALLLGAPAFASSNRSQSRYRSIAAVSSTKSIEFKQGNQKAPRTQINKEFKSPDPFAVFGKSVTPSSAKNQENKKDVLAYLKKNGLLKSNQTLENDVSGQLGRKEFSHVVIGAHCQVYSSNNYSVGSAYACAASPYYGSWHPANAKPTASNNTVTTNEGTPYIFSAADFNFVDTDSSHSLASVQITGLPAVGVLQLNSSTVTLNQVILVADITAGNLEFVPIGDENGAAYDSFQFSVNDSLEDSVSSYSMTIDVTAVNDAPTITGTPTTSVAEDSLYSFTPTGADVEGDTLTYSITNKPTWATFNTSDGTLSGTPNNSDVGTTTGIVITVTDTSSAANSLASFDLEVTNINDAPLILSSAVTVVNAGDAYSMNFSASDVDAGAVLTYSAPILPSWLSFDTTTGILSGTPTVTDEGDHNVTLRANDGVVDEDLVFTITVKQALVVDTSITTTDADGDGIPDIEESDKDSDSDGIFDDKESNILDTDNDEILDYLDTDSDGDGISDADEGKTDTDGDGIPDRLKSNTLDTDADGILDYVDNDSDGDGIDDGVEGSFDSDGDGILDRFESNTNDTDLDGLFDYLDSDSDNDGKLDGGEGSADSDSDGILDRIESDLIDIDGDGASNENDIDSDGDAINDADEVNADSDSDGFLDRFESNTLDIDSNGITNHLDIDSDGDGISDTIEGVKDNDNDSIPDLLESNIIDTDNDGLFNFEDTDSDADGIPDSFERSVDTDSDGIIDSLDTDSDADGIDDIVEGYIDSDADGVADYRDTDSDGDGKLDATEGISNADGDGYADRIESSILDGDNDSVVDELDDDSDGDGIADGTLTNSVTVGDQTTEVTSDVVGAKTTTSTETDGSTTLTTSVNAVNESQDAIAIEIKGKEDGSANYSLQVTSDGNTYNVDASFDAAGVRTVIGTDLSITSEQSINDIGVKVIALPSGLVEHRFTSSVNGVDKTNSAAIALPGAATSVDTSGNISTTLDQSTADNPATYQVTATIDGKSGYSVSPIIDDGNGGTTVGEASTASSSIPGSAIKLDDQGVVTTTAVTTLNNGNSVEVIVKTLPNGESLTSYILSDGTDGEPLYTVNPATPFESGNKATISVENGETTITTETKVSRPIQF